MFYLLLFKSSREIICLRSKVYITAIIHVHQRAHVLGYLKYKSRSESDLSLGKW